MRRREFITLLGGAAAAWPMTARAQQGGSVRRIGILMSLAADDEESQVRLAAFIQALQDLGWTADRDLHIDIRWGNDSIEVTHHNAAELVALAPDVIMASRSAAASSLKRATSAVPIVFVQVAEPLGGGLIESFAKPGGNVTGFASIEYGVSARWLELLKEIAPGVTRVVVVRDPDSMAGPAQFAAIQSVAPSLGVELSSVGVRAPSEIERAITALSGTSNGGLIVTTSTRASAHRELMLALTARYKLPAVYPFRFYVASGGLMLRSRLDRSVPPRGRLRRPHPQGREAEQPSGAGACQIRNGDQSQNRKGARPRRAALLARPRGRGDRVAEGA
jgi:putative ABC transport system substrate-binding protein